jgi:hypothetical protein
MASEKQIAANRANALKSRGPRSVGGKVRASRNAICHGLAANIWKEASAVVSIERLTQLFCAGGHSEKMARVAALAEYKAGLVRKARSSIGEQICEAAEGGGPEKSLAENLVLLQSIDRYEKRIASLKKTVFWKMMKCES